MKTKLLSLFVALIATTALWASNTITYTATKKLPETTDRYSSGLHTNAFNVSISSHSFSGGTGTITFSGELTTIGWSAFRDCSGLTSVTIPSSVTTIGWHAFQGCSGLTSVTIPSSVTTIGDYAFYNCSGLTSVTIPSSVITIEYKAFCNCRSLTSITIPNSVTTIGDEAFYQCSGLTSVTIGNSVTTIGYSAFKGCSGLTSVTIPNSVTTIGWSAFSGCSGLTSVTIPNSVTTIGDDAFYQCSGLTSVTIPNSVTTIGDYAFDGCNKITNLIFGSNLTTIGNSAFANCNRIDTMTIYAVEPPAITETTFKNVSRYAFLYVPQSSERKYKTDAYWSYFDIQTISAKNTSISGDEVVVLPSTDNATITWPQTDDADTYTLEIKKNGELVCILTFNSQGQLINIAFTLARNGERPANYATKTLTGYQFTITGLESGTAYTYAVTAKDASQQVLQTYSGDFTTTGGTATDLLPLPYEENSKFLILNSKLIKNGQLLIEHNGILYNAHGARVR